MSKSKWLWFLGLAVFSGLGCGGGGGAGGSSDVPVPERIFFVKADAAGDKEIFSMDVAGGDLLQLTHNDSDDDTPVGSRTNRKIYYASHTPSPGIYEMNDDGTAIRFVCAADPSVYHIEDITPNGKFLVVVHDTGAGKSMIEFLSTVQGSLDHSVGFANFKNTSPSVRADGNKIVFLSDKDASPDVWIAPLSGNSPTRLTHGFNDSHPVFSSPTTTVSGWQIYFYRGGFVNTLNPEGGIPGPIWAPTETVGRMRSSRANNQIITTLTDIGGHSELRREGLGAGGAFPLPATPDEEESYPFWR